MPELSKERVKLRNRIKRIQGQMEAVDRVLTEKDDCADVLMLLAAVRGGINGLMAEVLEDHIRLHLLNPGHKDFKTESAAELADDLVDIVRAYLK
jgi:DNA-binding FrmR family transcriptional regulator